MCTLSGARRSEIRVHYLPKAQEGTGHEGVSDQFVPSHMRLLASYPRDQLDGLLGSEGVHGLLPSI